jgi:hypothetical protein
MYKTLLQLVISSVDGQNPDIYSTYKSYFAFMHYNFHLFLYLSKAEDFDQYRGSNPIVAIKGVQVSAYGGKRMLHILHTLAAAQKLWMRLPPFYPLLTGNDFLFQVVR